MFRFSRPISTSSPNSDSASESYSNGSSSSSGIYYTLSPNSTDKNESVAYYESSQLIASGEEGDASSGDASPYSSSSSNQSSPPHSERAARGSVYRSRSTSIGRVDASLVSPAVATRPHPAATEPAHRPAISVATSNARFLPTVLHPTRTPSPPVFTSTPQLTTAPAHVRFEQIASRRPGQ